MTFRRSITFLLALVASACTTPNPTDSPMPTSPFPAESPLPIQKAPAQVRSVPWPRPVWNGERKPARVNPLRSYRSVWRGTVAVQELRLVGNTLYAISDRLHSVSLEGGAWIERVLPGLETEAWSSLSSDGLHLFLGSQSGKVVGYNPTNDKQGLLAILPSAVTGIELLDGKLLVASALHGIYRISLDGRSAQPLNGPKTALRSADLAIGTQAVFSVSNDQVWLWPLDGQEAGAIPRTEGATAVTSHKGVLYIGTADGWLLKSRYDGQTLEALDRVIDTPIQTLGTDGSWLYAGTGNSAYMVDLETNHGSPCHSGFAGTITDLTVLNAFTVLVGTEQGLYSMPR